MSKRKRGSNQADESRITESVAEDEQKPRNTHVFGEPRAAFNPELTEARRGLLQRELEALGLDVPTIQENGQASKVYSAFVTPKESMLKRALEEAQEPAAKRVANQIAFLVKQQRAEHSEFLRNKDEADTERASRGIALQPLALVLDNVRSAYNVGNILRTAETASVARVLTCGLTPTPPHDKIKKTAFSAAETVPTVHYPSTVEAVRALQADGFTVYGMETTSRSQIYANVAFPKHSALVLGNEVNGIDTAVMEACDELIEIPTYGLKNSLNVSSACPVVVFEILRQWGLMAPPKGADATAD